MRVRLLERPLGQLAEQVRISGRDGAGGLLIGQVRGEVAWVEKVLPCRNVARMEDRSVRFAFDPQVLANVRRSLEAGSASILGSYRAFVGGRYEWATPPEPTWVAPGGLWLLATSEMDGTTLPRVWSSPDGSAWAELAIEAVRPRPRVGACPE